MELRVELLFVQSAASKYNDRISLFFIGVSKNIFISTQLYHSITYLHSVFEQIATSVPSKIFLKILPTK